MIDVLGAPAEILQLRLANQHLAQQRWTDPRAMVAHLGAIQAQDYPAALWALGLRVAEATRASLECAFNSGAILRTHVLRPTWHFVAPEDVRWMLALTGPRVARAMGRYDGHFGLDAKAYRRSTDAIANALAGGKHLTRTELSAVIGRARVPITSSMKLTRLVMHAELNAVICSGPRRGKQFTYALFDERVPAQKPRSHDRALAELAERYFRSHGPARLHDFAWWSGLKVSDARAGVEMLESRLEQRE